MDVLTNDDVESDAESEMEQACGSEDWRRYFFVTEVSCMEWMGLGLTEKTGL